MNNRVTGGWKALKLINSIKCEADSYEKSYKKKKGRGEIIHPRKCVSSVKWLALLFHPFPT